MTIILILFVQTLVQTVDAGNQVTRDSLTLEQAYAQAVLNAPVRSEIEIQQLTAKLKQQNYSTLYLPQIAVSGQAVYNSEVAEIPIAVPGQSSPSISNDQYKVSVGIEQLLFDGGSVGKRKQLEKATLDYANQTVAVSLYSIRKNVESSFFGAVIAQTHLRSLEIRLDDLTSKLDEVNALVDEGVLTSTSADRIQVEILSLRQQISAVNIEAQTAVKILGEWIGKELPDDVVLVLPDQPLDTNTAAPRPELIQFELARTVLDSQEDIQSLATKPRLSSFGEIAYGRAPGMNLFENSFKPFFSLGVRFRWLAWDWNRLSRERQIIQLKQQSLDVQQSLFTQQQSIALAQKAKDVQRLRAALDTDDAVISLRTRIRDDAEYRFDNGVANTTDYLREVNAEHLARLSRELHRIELSKALIEYQTIQGTK